MSKFQQDVFVDHPDGGQQCNLCGMTDGCHMCEHYRSGDTEGCEERVGRLMDAICTNFMLSRDFLFGNGRNKIIESFNSDSSRRPVKIKKGHYIYKGFLIYSIGYYNPEQRVCWEAVDINGNGCAHGFSKKECMMWIDELLKREKQNDRQRT